MRKIGLALLVLTVSACGTTRVKTVIKSAPARTPATDPSAANASPRDAHNTQAQRPHVAPTRLHSCDPNIRVSRETSCPFAENVFKAYAAAYQGHDAEGRFAVHASSPVTGKSYRMVCESTNAGATATCRGGTDAIVRFPVSAAEVYEPPLARQAPEPEEESRPETEGGAGFCTIHECIGEFETEDGSIVECADGTYSHAGGKSGACSDHGGEAG